MTTIRTVDVPIADTTGMKKLLSAVNFAKNPRGVNSAGVGGSSGTGGVGVNSFPTTGGPLADAPTFIRRSFTTAPTAGNITVTLRGAGVTDIDPADIGTLFNLALFVRSSKAHTGVNASLGWYNGSTFLSSVSGASDTLAANTWKLLPVVSASAVASTTLASPQVTIPVAGFTGGFTSADTIDVSAFLLYKPLTGFDGTYFDGSSAGCLWQGPAHASRSSKVVGIG